MCIGIGIYVYGYSVKGRSIKSMLRADIGSDITHGDNGKHKVKTCCLSWNMELGSSSSGILYLCLFLLFFVPTWAAGRDCDASDGYIRDHQDKDMTYFIQKKIVWNYKLYQEAFEA